MYVLAVPKVWLEGYGEPSGREMCDIRGKHQDVTGELEARRQDVQRQFSAYHFVLLAGVRVSGKSLNGSADEEPGREM